MPTKGMRSLCFSPRTPSFSISSQSTSQSSSSTPRRRFTDSMIDRTIDAAASIIMKWDAETSAYAKVTSLFYESKREALRFIRSVNDLQKTMHLLVSDQESSSDKLIRAKNLMQIAMKRLQKEFYQILSMNRAHLDPESVSTRSSLTSARSSMLDFVDDSLPDDKIREAGDSITEIEEVSSMAMSDLKLIADCMIASGYAKECIHIYKTIRKSIIDEGIYKLGIEKMSSSQANKMDWDALDLKIKNWLEAEKISMRTLFTGERILCNQVFATSDSIKESCFTDISKEAATLLFGFPELVAKTKKSPPEKVFRVLDMYSSISEDWQEIETIFSFESTSSVREQALNSLVRLSESVRGLLMDFESTIQKDSSKTMVPGGGLHPLTISSMNYLTLLADYSNILADIIADWPPPVKSSLPASFLYSPESDDSSAPAISARIGWLILVLLCKLDGKAKHYKDISLAYLFLANNLQHVISKVRTSNLQYILGEEWITKHEAKVKQFAANYEQLAWGEVFASLPENPKAPIAPGKAKDYFRKFNSSFEVAYWRQSSCVILDSKLRDEIKVSIGKKLVALYREFSNTHRSTVGDERMMRLFVRFSPEDIGNYLSDLFFGTVSSGSSSTSTSSWVSYHHRRQMRSLLRV
ncbi:Ankyrin repeat family protein isoform 1 [Hibiscus syriacus]|uniref:Exocyst subunit Exo70 family protein n=1 Tax=Hibiscus syriacus TaxID=106335 RepID=A0A6A3CNU6_HIBSY|nr:exocyst complex component EXO70H1-like [Hibiscus syriacus]KAE8731050.1 Ankyrin repeat family protein isoform 1 [Hibiscus syriacus]